MIWEGMLLEGLAVERAVHDRYHASRRNPWNEIECGDHYARSMASYGVYLAAGGFEYHGPKQHIGFAPRLSPENFKCAFTGAEGWGSFSQNAENGKLTAVIAVRWGKLLVKTIALESPAAVSASVKIGKNLLAATFTRTDKRVLVSFGEPVEMVAGQSLEILLS